MLLSALAEAFPELKANFDLSDCDKVLRVEGEGMEIMSIIVFIKEHGFMCEILDC